MPKPVRPKVSAHYLTEMEAQNAAEPLNKTRKPDTTIAINLPAFFERCRECGQNAPTEADLHRHLKTSKARKFEAYKTVNSPSGKVFQCRVFQRSLSEQPVI
jgi:hypothetical protein